MAEQPGAGAGQQMPGSPSAGQGGGQTPFGSSPATQPTRNGGIEAAGVARFGLILKLLEETIPMLGAASEPGKDALKAIQLIAKHIPPGTNSPATEKNQVQQLMLSQAQAGPRIAQMRQAMAGGGAPPGADNPAAA